MLADPPALRDVVFGSGLTHALRPDAVLVGGDPAVLERVRPLLEVLGEVVYCGGPGAGQAMKLVFNTVLAVTMCGVAEAVALGERQGLEVATILRVLERGGAGPMVARKGPMIAAGRYPASFALSLMRKDAGLALEAASDAGAGMPLAERAAEAYGDAQALGLGEEDYAAIAELYRPQP